MPGLHPLNTSILKHIKTSKKNNVCKNISNLKIISNKFESEIKIKTPILP